MIRFASLALVVLMVGCGSSDDGVAPENTADSGAADTGSAADTAVNAEDSALSADASPDVVGETAGETAGEAGEAGTVACTEAGGKIFAGNGHCYFPLPTTKTLIGAANECKTLGNAHIVTITSGEEQDFIKNNIGTGEQWIGLTSTVKTSNKADFDWLGGEAVTYDGWAAGSPASRGRCAVQLATGKWEDRDCIDLKIAVCERE